MNIFDKPLKKLKIEMKFFDWLIQIGGPIKIVKNNSVKYAFIKDRNVRKRRAI